MEYLKFLEDNPSLIVACTSQLGQDAWVLYETQQKRNGFFVDFGAGDGKRDSNTFLLEHQFGWTGLLAEPHKENYEKASKCRTSPVHNIAIVGDQSITTAQFRSCKFDYISTLSMHLPKDNLANARESFVAYDVSCLTLEKFLETNSAPKQIDYLSLDVEGGELAILESFNFKNWDIRLITVEHNHVPETRKAIKALLYDKGYEALDLPEVTAWDDWFRRIEQ